MNGFFTAIIAGGIALALFGIVPIEYILTIFVVSAVGLHITGIK